MFYYTVVVPAPPLPPHYVCRQQLLDEMATKLCEPSLGTDDHRTSLTITGAEGFGKTSMVIALCHHPRVVEQFMDGFVIADLGQHHNNSNLVLKGLYELLTDKDCDDSTVLQKISQLTNGVGRNLLVVLDDVWDVANAKMIISAFSNCKIVIVTKRDDIEKYIPTKYVVVVGPMEQDEALSLLTSEITHTEQCSQVDKGLLVDLAQYTHLCPLKLSRIRGKISHYMKHYNLSLHEAVLRQKSKLLNPI